MIRSLAEAGAKWIQIDEPIFGLTISAKDAPIYYAAFKQAAQAIQEAAGKEAHVVFTTYFNGIANNIQIVKDLPEGGFISLQVEHSTFLQVLGFIWIWSVPRNSWTLFWPHYQQKA